VSHSRRLESSEEVYTHFIKRNNFSTEEMEDKKICVLASQSHTKKWSILVTELFLARSGETRHQYITTIIMEV
jgi:hypothetical protein